MNWEAAINEVVAIGEVVTVPEIVRRIGDQPRMDHNVLIGHINKKLQLMLKWGQFSKEAGKPYVNWKRIK